ncbi:MAG: hypothetical protein GY707_10695 [Desulfobacteraceae bacterium]|nr:hypothetical protein [Desulfobacteraceae bacterium]
MTKIERLKMKVVSEFSDSDLTLATDSEIEKLIAEFPGLPSDYLDLLKTIGYGSYGKMGFSIYGGPLDPDEIFDENTAKELASYIFVGDDYAGWMIGYKVEEPVYIFKEFDHHQVMEFDEPTNIIDFLSEELFRE